MIAVVTPMTRAGKVKKRPAGVARVDGRIRLYHVRDFPASNGWQSALERADNAARERLIKPEWVSDCESSLSYSQIARASYIKLAAVIVSRPVFE